MECERRAPYLMIANSQGDFPMSTELSACYQRIEDDKAKFRQLREWLLFGDADDMAARLDLRDAAIDERAVMN